MPDVRSESHRTSYDDAIEVASESGDVVGVATFPVDQEWDGTPTGRRDSLPIRVYAMVPEDGGVETAWLDLDAARDLVDVLEAAILQVEFVRDRRRRSPHPLRVAA